jgi:hypothetical protein
MLVDPPSYEVRHPIPQQDVDALIIEVFGGRELVGCGIPCCTIGEAFEIFEGDPDEYNLRMGFHVFDPSRQPVASPR